MRHRFANGSSQACLVNQQLVHARVFFFNSRVRASVSPSPSPQLAFLNGGGSRVSFSTDGNLIEDFRLCLLLDFRRPSIYFIFLGDEPLSPVSLSQESFTRSQGFFHPLFSRATRKFGNTRGHLIETMVRNWANDS